MWLFYIEIHHKKITVLVLQFAFVNTSDFSSTTICNLQQFIFFLLNEVLRGGGAMERKSQLSQSVESAASIYQLAKLNNFIQSMFWLCSEVVKVLCEPPWSIWRWSTTSPAWSLVTFVRL